MSSNDNKRKKNLKIAQSIPCLIDEIDEETIKILLNLNGEGTKKVIVLQYIGTDENPSNDVLLRGIEQSIKYYNVSNARIMIISDPMCTPPVQSEVIRCVTMTFVGAIKAKMMNLKEVIRDQKGIQFVAVSRIGNTGDQANVGFFKPLSKTIARIVA